MGGKGERARETGGLVLGMERAWRTASAFSAERQRMNIHTDKNRWKQTLFEIAELNCTSHGCLHPIADDFGSEGPVPDECTGKRLIRHKGREIRHKEDWVVQTRVWSTPIARVRRHSVREIH